jgi:hypothetical protein
VKQTGSGEAEHLRLKANGVKSNRQENEETVIDNEMPLDDDSETDSFIRSVTPT